MNDLPTKSYVKIILYTQAIIFTLIINYFIFISDLTRSLFLVVAFLGLLFLILGIVLIFLARKVIPSNKVSRRLKLFLTLTGISTIAPLVFTLLHNFFYAMAILSENITFLSQFFEILHAISFIISLLVAPLTFLVCMILSLIYLNK
ncbi:hypothetical protein HN385_00685 [archaeon]|jgi:hypothetical protein|nr:hypothetical protein [archaeon]MBT3450935.1 hypothetical protein [archaeon]MBT6869581.1 hypothetical protein [archaeon]MBT7193427.1 hypothetical protein [archaeon]MBT7381018.1 hypothetical protein [archaeon]